MEGVQMPPVEVGGLQSTQPQGRSLVGGGGSRGGAGAGHNYGSSSAAEAGAPFGDGDQTFGSGTAGNGHKSSRNNMEGVQMPPVEVGGLQSTQPQGRSLVGGGGSRGGTGAAGYNNYGSSSAAEAGPPGDDFQDGMDQAFGPGNGGNNNNFEPAVVVVGGAVASSLSNFSAGKLVNVPGDHRFAPRYTPTKKADIYTMQGGHDESPLDHVNN